MVKQSDKVRVNEEIRADPVRVVEDDGNMLGVMPTREALDKAKLAGLDLVEISPNADPPVCKILDYGKYRYELQKKKKEAKKKQVVTSLKELKMRPNIGEHDYQTKLKNAKRFLEQHDKVKFTLRFRGREITHKELADELFQRIIEDMEGSGKVEMAPKMEGRQLVMVIAPE